MRRSRRSEVRMVFLNAARRPGDVGREALGMMKVSDYFAELYVAGRFADAGWNMYLPHRIPRRRGI